jgi:hypothetical protein
MLGWLFPPSCPCDAAAKAWVEERLEWLAEEFDDHAFNGRRIVLPTREFFPDPYDGSPDTVRTLLDRVCGFMDVVPELVELRFITNAGGLELVNEFGDAIPSGAAGTYEETDAGTLVTLDTGELSEPMGLVGTIAHELGHAKLLGEGRVMSDEYDHELLTDLTTIHFGLGIFLANTPRNWMGQNTRWPGTTLVKPEYMTPPMFGWALAHLAWFRGEENPTWAAHLKFDTRGELKQGLRYLFKTGDSGYKPARFRKPG